MTTLVRLTSANGQTMIYALSDGYRESDARADYLDETGYDAFASSQRFTFDQCEVSELANFAELGQP